MSKVLVTGAGSGFGQHIVFELAKRGHEVYAGVELPSQITLLHRESKAHNLELKEVFKLDITSQTDITHALKFDIDILVNNAGVGEGGALIDIPQAALKKQFEVNFFATVDITQQFLRQFTKRKSGRVVFISSIAGLMTVKSIGAYCASKHALEAAAEAFKAELSEEFNISIATINPGPYETGFNDRMIEASNNWYDKETSVLNHDNPKFPLEQVPAERDIAQFVDVIVDPKSKFRNVFPAEQVETVKTTQKDLWEA